MPAVPFVVLVSGSRWWTSTAPIRADLEQLQAEHGEHLVVVHGGCERGADALADRVARDLGVTVVAVPADWETHDRDGLTAVPCRCSRGKRTCRGAGPRRNQRMLDEHHPDLVLAYRAAGVSNGTDDMVRRARAAGVEVRQRHPHRGRAA